MKNLKVQPQQIDLIGDSGSYINTREVTKRFRVEPGDYIIIPSTYNEDQACEFLLRAFTENAYVSQ
jgi:calpain